MYNAIMIEVTKEHELYKYFKSYCEKSKNLKNAREGMNLIARRTFVRRRITPFGVRFLPSRAFFCVLGKVKRGLNNHKPLGVLLCCTQYYAFG